MRRVLVAVTAVEDKVLLVSLDKQSVQQFGDGGGLGNHVAGSHATRKQPEARDFAKTNNVAVTSIPYGVPRSE